MNELIKQISPQQMIRRASMLPKTGQTTSYRTGDDGDVEAGKAHRFQTVGNLVYDWSTMLCWVANPAAIIPGDTGGIAATAAGVWTAAGAVNGGYTYGRIVQGDGNPDAKFYVCILTHTEAHEPPNATYWVETVWTASAANVTTPAMTNWDNAIDRCLMLSYGGIGGYSVNNPLGWRLPNSLEASSILHQGNLATWHPWMIVPPSSNIITSTTYTNNTTRSLRCYSHGVTTYIDKADSTGLPFPVRSLIV